MDGIQQNAWLNTLSKKVEETNEKSKRREDVPCQGEAK